MTPVELSYSVNDVEIQKVIAPDGERAVLTTPIGNAEAQFDPKEKFLPSLPIFRLGTLFPGEYSAWPITHSNGLNYYADSIIDYIIPKRRNHLNLKRPTLRWTVKTSEGELVIKATGYDPVKPSQPPIP
jgi:hypothetical protein